MPTSKWISDRALECKPSLIGRISKLAEECNAINLSEGYPDYPAPDFLKDAGIKAINKNFNQYKYSQELCEAIAHDFSSRHGIDVSGTTEVSICCGQSGAFSSAIFAVIGYGDEVLILDPSYETYGPCVTSAGGTPVFVSLPPPHWIVTELLLENALSAKTKAVIINSPNNPTGHVMSMEELTAVANFCIRHDLLAITDEVYEHLIFGSSRHISLASLPSMKERTIVTSSLSKTFSVTGWRVGWAISPAPICEAINKLHCKFLDSPPAPFQVAALTALSCPDDYYLQLKNEYELKKSLMCEALEFCGFRIDSEPQGGMFVFAKLPGHFQGSDFDFAEWLIRTKGVAVVPGSNFFHCQPSDGGVGASDCSWQTMFVRVAFCKSEETILKASTALKKRTLP